MNDISLSKQLYFLRNAVKGNLFVSVNSGKLGVILPGFLYDSPNVQLLIGLWLASPIRDLDVNEDGIRATLSFSGQGFRCSLPWSSIWLITVENSTDGCVWHLDAPQDTIQVQPQLGATGSDDPVPRHRDAYIEQLKPSSDPKPKRQLPPGWGGLVRDSDVVPSPKEPA